MICRNIKYTAQPSLALRGGFGPFPVIYTGKGQQVPFFQFSLSEYGVLLSKCRGTEPEQPNSVKYWPMIVVESCIADKYLTNYFENRNNFHYTGNYSE